MKTKHILGGIGIALLGVVATSVGCGGDTSGAGGSTGATGGGSPSSTHGPTSTSSIPLTDATTTMTTTTVSTGTTTSSAGGGGAGGGGNHSFATAIPVDLGVAPTITHTLKDPLTADFYSFTGKAGDRFIILATAQGLSTDPMHNADDPTVTDTVVTLYLPDMSTVWALDDDAWPRSGTDSTLFTELPMDGTYYFTVEDCNALALVNSNVHCADPAGITNLDYQVSAGDLTVNMTETVGSAAAPTTIKYTVPQGNMTGQYGSDVLVGDFATATDVHTFNFTPPANTMTDPAARTRAYFWVQPIGNADGTGSAVDIVLTAKDSAGNVLATSDQQNYKNGDDPTNGPLQFSFPLDNQFAGDGLGAAYTLEVALSSKTPLVATKNFYIIDHFMGPFEFGQSEKEKADKSGAPNDTPVGAETLNSPATAAGAFFIDGNLSSATDVDFFTAAVPTGMATVFFQCESARDGSGITGFKAELTGSKNGMTGPFAPIATLGPEAIPAIVDLLSDPMGSPVAGATSVYLKVSATSEDTTNLGTNYHCAIFFSM